MKKQLAYRIVSAFTIIMLALSVLPAPQVMAHPALPPRNLAIRNAAIGTLNVWSNVFHDIADAATPAYSIPAGSNRLLVVAIASSVQTSGSARTVTTLTYGGQTLTSVDGDMAAANRQHTQLYYLNEAGIAAASGTTLFFSVTGGTTRVNDIFAAVYTGVDQTNPITDHKTYTSNAGTTNSPAFPTAMTVNAGDQAVEIISSDRTGSGTTRTFTAATNWTIPSANQQTYTTGDAVRDGVGTRSVPVSNTTDTSSMTFNGTSLASMTGMSIKAFVGAGTTTLGNGVDPSNATIGPGGAATQLDAFTLNTDTGTDTVTGATVTLAPAGAFNNIATVALTSDDGTTTTYCSTTPASNTVSLSGCTIPVIASPTQFKVVITPKSASAMQGVSTGVSYDTSGTVTAISATNPTAGTDSGSATVTVDNASPVNPTGFSGTVGDAQVVLNWTNPADLDLSQLVVVHHAGSATATTQPTEGKTNYAVGDAIGTGTVACVVTSAVHSAPATCTDTTVSNGTAYYYRIFAMDGFGNYSSGGTTAGPYTPVNITTATGAVTAVATSGIAPSILVTMPYTNDTNGNNTYTVDYKLSSDSGWTNWVTGAAHTTSPFTTTITPLSPGTSYDVQATYLDDDGITGINPQFVLGVMTNHLTTVGNGSDPTNATIGPGGIATPLDAFTLATDTGTDTVTGATVTLGPVGAFNNVGALAITSDDGLTSYCSTSAAPTSNTVALTGCTIPAFTTSPVQYKVVITPKSASAMPGVSSGVSYDTTGTVTAITSSNSATYTDTTSATVTIDNKSPGIPTSLVGTPGDSHVDLNWINPSDTDLSKLLVVRRAGSAVSGGTTPAEGTTYTVGNTISSSTVACVVSAPATTCTDSGLTNGTNYYYKIWAMDAFVNYSNGGTAAGPYSFSDTATAAGTATATATAGSATSISVAMPYTNDTNGNNTYTVDYCLTAANCPVNGGWTNRITAAAHATSPYRVTITGLTASTSYDVRVTYNDADGVTGVNPQTISPVITNTSITVGNGVDPSNAIIGPDGVATPLDAFTLQTTAGTDTVTGATVTLAPTGAFNNIARVAFTSDDGLTSYCATSTAPTSNTVALTGCTIPTITTSSTPFKVVITPKTAGNMPAVPGASYATTGTVTVITSTNGPVYNDTTSATVTVDNLSPANPSSFSGSAGDTQVILNWTNPADLDLSQLVVVHRVGSATATTQPTEGKTNYVVGDAIGTGTVACVVSSAVPSAPATCTDTPLTNGLYYYYRIFAMDGFGNYSNAGTIIAIPYQPYPASNNATTVGTATATGTGSGTSITVTMPYTLDQNGDNTYTVDYCLNSANCSVSGAWQNWRTNDTHSASPYQTTITGLSEATSYDIKATYNDAQGVSGSNPQFILGVTTHNLTTVGNGASEPAPATLGPGGSPTMLDTFSLVTDTGTDTVTGATVTLAPAGAYNDIASVALTSDDGLTPYCATSIAPASNAVTLTGCTIPTVTTLSAQYKVLITPKSAAAMPVPPGASYATTGTVTAITSTNGPVYNDTTSATLTVDNLSPANPTLFSGAPGDTQMVLNWTNPADLDLSQLVVVRRAGSATATTQPTEGKTDYLVGDAIGTGTVACVVNSLAPATCTDIALTNGTAYYYRIFAMDVFGNYSNAGLTAGPYTPLPNSTAAGTATAAATSGSATGITVLMPYTNDINGNNTYTVDYCLTSAICPVTGAWQNWVTAAAHTTSPHTEIITGLALSTSYDIRVTYNDTEGVTGTNPQTIRNVMTVMPPGTYSWVAPAGINSVTVQVWGGGGKGGSLGGLGVTGGGGGGAYSKATFTVIPGNTYSVVVGAGATTSAAGGDSYFATQDLVTTYVLAKGGASVPDANAAGGSGGAANAGVGSTKYSGGNGATGSGAAGGGGGSSAGTATNGANATSSTGATAPTGGGNGGNGGTAADGTAGSLPGGGGGGTYSLSGAHVGGNGAAGKVVFSGVTTTASTTVGNGASEPASVTIGPGGAATPLDAFTLATDTGADAVTGVTVTLAPAGAYNNIATLALTSGDGLTTYCSTSTAPTSNSVDLISCGIPVNTTPIQYELVITPKSASAMPAVPGASYATTGTVTAITSSDSPVYSDTTSATLTVDNLSPANPILFSGSAGDTQVVLHWTNPADLDLSQLVVVRRAGSATATTQPTEGKTNYLVGDAIGTGTVACVISSAVHSAPATCTDTALTNGTNYYYRIFAMDAFGNYSSGGLAIGPYAPYPASNNATIVGTATATATGLAGAIQVTMPYTNDENGDNTYTVDYCLTADNCPGSVGTWTNWVTNDTHSASPYSTTITSLEILASYDIRVRYNDTDGVSGTNPQTIFNVITNTYLHVDNGVDPSNATIGPGGAATPLDAFTLYTESGTDTVTGASVTLAPAGAYNNIATVAITSDDGLTSYCATSSAPTSNIVGLTGCTIPTITTLSTPFKVVITPKTAGNMPAVPGASYATTGTVTAITSTNGPFYNDSASATVTVDNLSPANPTPFTGLASDTQVALNWTNPADLDLSQVVVVRRAGSATATTQPTEGKTNYVVGDAIGTGTVACVITSAVHSAPAACTDTGLIDRTAYYYRIFAMDGFGNYSSGGTTAGPYTPLVIATTVGTATAASNSATSITVSMPYQDDGNDNNTYTVDYCLSSANCPGSVGTWQNWVTAAAHTSSPYTETITGLALSTRYDFRVRYNDIDGVTGTNPQTILNVMTVMPPGTYSWLAPTGAYSATVQAWGGGGSGGSVNVALGGTGGGGGGAYSTATFDVAAANTYSIIVGAGASAGGGIPADGLDSSFSLGLTTYVLAKGGASVPDNAGTGGLGGSAASGSGDIKYSGGNGAAGGLLTSGGGGSSAGTASDGTNASNATGATAPSGGGNGGSGGSFAAGTAGSLPGGGGGGASSLIGTAYSGGNGANGKLVFSYLIDTTPPVVGAVTVTPSDGTYTSSAPTISATLTETESKVTGCEFTTDGSTWLPGVVSGSATVWTCTGHPTSLSGGLVINVRGTSAGGTGTGISVARTVDSTAPVVGVVTVSPTASVFTSATPTITATLTEDVSTVYGCEYTINYGQIGEAWTTGVLTGSGPTWTCTGNPTGLTGDLFINVRGISGGGTGTGSVVDYTVDNTAPTILIGSPSASTTVNGPVTFSVTYADTNFNASTLIPGNITLNKTGTADGTVGVSGTGTTRTVTISNITGAGTLSISIAAGTASDLLGNLAPAAGPSATFIVVYQVYLPLILK